MRSSFKSGHYNSSQGASETRTAIARESGRNGAATLSHWLLEIEVSSVSDRGRFCSVGSSKAQMGCRAVRVHTGRAVGRVQMDVAEPRLLRTRLVRLWRQEGHDPATNQTTDSAGSRRPSDPRRSTHEGFRP